MTRTLFAAAFASVTAIQTVSAASFTYADIDRPDFFLGYGDSYEGSFNIVTGDGDSNVTIAGYTAGTNGTFSDIAGYGADGTLTSAFAFFYLKDANQGNDSWDINVNIYNFLDGHGPLSGANHFTHFDALSGAAFDFLNNNGVISYTVTNTGTNNGAKFTLEFARLEATSGTASVPTVPDGGSTFALLGLTCLGLVGGNYLPRRQPIAVVSR